MGADDIRISVNQLLVAIVATMGILGAVVKVLADAIVKKRLKDTADLVTKPDLASLIHDLPSKDDIKRIEASIAELEMVIRLAKRRRDDRDRESG